MSTKRVYLDVCALSRPFDDQTQARIRLETEAVNLILSQARLGALRLMHSAAHRVEIADLTDIEERQALEKLLAEIGTRPPGNWRNARRRAEELTQQNFGPADATHLALAEQLQADFVSTDDRLLKRARRARLKVWVGSPVEFCEKEGLR